jgi:hypothetical protein
MKDHHALLYIGPHEECLLQIPREHRTGVDAEVIVRDSLDIAEARALAEKAWSRPIAGEKRTFVISCTHIPHDAQNALLKLFEDPPATAQFYIIVPRAELLLPTLRSRLHLAYEANAAHEPQGEATRAYLAASYRDRLAHVAELAKEKEKTKDTTLMRALVAGIERAAGFGVAKDAHGERSASFLRDALLCSQYAETRGASHKMLLEHLALSIPQAI